MRTPTRVLEAVHIVSLATWVAALVTGALVAGIIFSTMRQLEPTFGYFAAYTQDQSDLGAGYIQARVFLVCDFIQFGAACLAILTLIASVVLRRAAARPSTFVRSLLMAGALCTFSYHFFVLVPRMDTNSQHYWAAAREGNMEQAEAYHQAFMADHPASVRTHGGISIFVLASLVAATWCLTGQQPAKRGATNDSQTAKGSS